MGMQMPSVIEKLGVSGFEIDYQVSDIDFIDTFRCCKSNPRLSDAFKKINHKASIGLAAAIAEFVYWRLDGYRNFHDAQNRIESTWVGAINLAYIKYVKYEIDEEMEPYEEEIDGVVLLMLLMLSKITNSYVHGACYIHFPLVSLALLARDVLPKHKKQFNAWLTDVTRRAAEAYPCRYNYEDLDGTDNNYYDSSDEPVIPREFFFDPSFPCDDASVKKAANQFLAGLDYKNNPYLYSPEEMIAKGFKGTPYSL
ncbi:MAG: hypothetical protein FWG14_07280 [Peptococcaceae bacterium]|nr:hypothetical protein [Peptococcaceae bacterium]